MDRTSQKLEVVWFFLKNTPAFLKNQGLHFIHQGISRLIYYLWKQAEKSSVAFDSFQRKFDRRKAPKFAEPYDLFW